MKVLYAEIGDIPDLVDLGEEMHEESSYSSLEYDPNAAFAFAQHYIEHPDKLAIIAVVEEEIVGMMAAQVIPYAFGEGKIAKNEILYVSPSYRGGVAALQMIEVYRRWAKEQKADIIHLGLSTGIAHVRTGKMFEKIGFREVGFVHQQEVTHNG